MRFLFTSDGTGEPWEYENGRAVRLFLSDSSYPRPVFNLSQWDIVDFPENSGALDISEYSPLFWEGAASLPPCTDVRSRG